jgi:glucose-fructose oxidoreductase
MNRRSFVKYTSAGLVSFSTPEIITSLYGKKSNLGIALVGLGYYSTDVLAPALIKTKNCHLAGIVTGTPSKIDIWKSKYKIADKNIYNYQNFDSIANNPDIDVIYIVLPPSMHRDYVIRAAATGKHVWCEKPMAMTYQECTDMIKACKDNKVKLSIGYRMQHEPNTQTLMKWAKSKPYGDIQSLTVNAGYVDGRKGMWKQMKAMGGGATIDMGVYCINGARYVTGMEPISVEAKSSVQRPDIYFEVEETMDFTLHFKNDVKAVCKTSFGMSFNDLDVICKKGGYKMAPYSSYNGNKGSASDGKLLNLTIDNLQARQMDDDALSIINNKKMMCPGEEGAKDIKIVEAIYKADKSGSRIMI